MFAALKFLVRSCQQVCIWSLKYAYKTLITVKNVIFQVDCLERITYIIRKRMENYLYDNQMLNLIFQAVSELLIPEPYGLIFDWEC